MDYLDCVKRSLGITHNKLDGDIDQSVAACKLDLRRVGVQRMPDDDALVIQAIKLFCKWQYNYQGAADRFERAYAGLRDAMSLCGDYREALAHE